MKKVFTVAITGKSGSGKSIICEYFKNRGVSVIDCDDIAKEVVLPGTHCLKRLRRRFGSQIITPDGLLNRKKLADLAFSDKNAKRVLDRITHPYILRELKGRLKDLSSEEQGVCIIEAPALIESGLYKSVDKIVLVSSKKEKKIDRIIKRDGIEPEKAARRIDAQTDDDTVRKIADLEIRNNGTLKQLQAQAEELIKKVYIWSEQKTNNQRGKHERKEEKRS